MPVSDHIHFPAYISTYMTINIKYLKGFCVVCFRGAAPSFIQKPAIKQADGGKRIIFECKIAAEPLPELTWFRDDIQLSDGGKYTRNTHTLAEKTTVTIYMNVPSNRHGILTPLSGVLF